jgi:molybdenum cofactor cytidylyltransferase
MGTNKLLLPWGGTSVLSQTIANARASAVDDILVVTGHDAERVDEMAGQAGARSLRNAEYAAGMLTSVQAAARALDAEALLVMLGDQPLVRPATIDALLDAYAGSPRGLVAPFYDGRRGNPVLIDRRHFPELLALPASAAPRVLLERHPDDLLRVNVEDAGILIDLDTSESYEWWRTRVEDR